MSEHTPEPWAVREQVREDQVTVVRDCARTLLEMNPMRTDGKPEAFFAASDALEDSPTLLRQRDELREAAKLALVLIEALMPGLRHIAVQDYRAVNETPIALSAAIEKATP